MAIPYKANIYKQPDGLVYRITCKRELASGLVKWLNENGIPAALSIMEQVEHIASGSTAGIEEEEYVVRQIDIVPPADFENVKSAVDSWLAQL